MDRSKVGEMHFGRPGVPAAIHLPHRFHNAKAFAVAYADCRIRCDGTFFELSHQPRGRLARPSIADPLTNLQRAMQMARNVAWIPNDTTIEDALVQPHIDWEQHT